MIAGPNGAGKSTFAQEFLPNEAGCLAFVNADLIASGLSPFAPETVAVQAGRLMISEIRRHLSLGSSFALETTLAGRRYERMIPAWKELGYHVQLIFLKLDTVDIAISRVAIRVAQGGHHVEEDVVRRRFEKGWSNFQNIYRDLVNSWELYDNSNERPALINRGGLQ